MSIFGSRTSGFFGGATGGGGGGLTSVAVDGTTIQGNGTIGNPLYSTTALPVINMGVDISSADYPLAGAGIYQIVYFGNYFLFNGTSIVDGSRVVLTNSNLNSIESANISYSGILGVFYQGTQVAVTSIQSGMTYEFLFDQSASIWYCLNPQPQPTYSADIGGLVAPYDIKTIGYYKFFNTGGGGQISLPSPYAFTGQEITIFNLDSTDAITITANYPVDLDGASVSIIPTQTCITLVSIEGSWFYKNSRTV